MRRLAYIANIRFPTIQAHGLQIANTCQALAKKGIDLELIIPKKFKLKGDPFEFYNIEKNFKVTPLFCVDFVAIKFLGWLGYWLESLTFSFSLWRYLKSHKYDAYYTRDLFQAMVLPQPFFVELHNIPRRGLFWHLKVWKRATGLVVISDGIKQALIKLGISADKILLARDAVDVEMFKNVPDKISCRRRLGLPLGQKIVVYTGHLYRWKGADILAAAAGLLTNDVQVYLVGGLDRDVSKFRKKYNFSNLHIIGWRKSGEIPFWLKAADLLVLPNSAIGSIGSVYTSPLKLFEYMSSGTPIVASDLPALREVVSEADVFFVEADNPDSLAAAIKKTLSNSLLASKIIQSAQQKSKQFTWEERANLIYNFLFG